ncbi:Uncharacterised protein [Mycobacteroides abscessus subsp. massiliense]|uniref:hypothetical protein n=1 Tax=Mycobacteroides abscessus TaxID=36809 RepID=UPI0009A73077|nr:hypothetical protein [Mycobacteroides abscessus]SKS09683.1 Uncharacterised protein [Mycobacteroides abscessus subsp. massiliense]
MSSLAEFAEQLPEPTELKRRCQIHAVLAALTEGRPTDEPAGNVLYRTNWQPGDDLATYANGGGDHWSILFSTQDGVFVRGYDHESEMNTYDAEIEYWPGLIDDLPQRFKSELGNNDLYDWFDGNPQTTVAIWRTPGGDRWLHGTPGEPSWGGEPYGGEDWLFHLLTEWSPSKVTESLYSPVKHVITHDTVARVMNNEPLAEALIRQFHPNPDITALLTEAERIGYQTPSS